MQCLTGGYCFKLWELCCSLSVLQGLYGLVMVGELKDHLDELAQPEALRYYG